MSGDKRQQLSSLPGVKRRSGFNIMDKQTACQSLSGRLGATQHLVKGVLFGAGATDAQVSPGTHVMMPYVRQADPDGAQQ